MGINLDAIFSQVQNRFIFVNRGTYWEISEETGWVLKENSFCQYNTSARHSLTCKILKLHFAVCCNMKLYNGQPWKKSAQQIQSRCVWARSYLPGWRMKWVMEMGAVKWLDAAGMAEAFDSTNLLVTTWTQPRNLLGSWSTGFCSWYLSIFLRSLEASVEPNTYVFLNAQPLWWNRLGFCGNLAIALFCQVPGVGNTNRNKEWSWWNWWCF